jgi:hypothetical protein
VRLILLVLSQFILYSVFAQTDSLTALVDKTLIRISIQTGKVRTITTVSGIDPSHNPSRFSYSENSKAFYGITRLSSVTHLYKLSIDGTYTDLGVLTYPNGTLYFAEAIAVDRSTQKVYVSASLNGAPSNADYHCESILELDTNTLACDLVAQLSTNTPIPDADLMTFDDNGTLYIMDNEPGGANYTYIYKSDLNGLSSSLSPIYSSGYIAPGDITIVGGNMYMNLEKDLHTFSLNTNSFAGSNNMYGLSEYGGENIRAISWLVECSETSSRDSFVLCEGESLQLTARNNSSVSWTTGETNRTISVSSGGWFIATSGGCTHTDSFWVEVRNNPNQTWVMT